MNKKITNTFAMFGLVVGLTSLIGAGCAQTTIDVKNNQEGTVVEEKKNIEVMMKESPELTAEEDAKIGPSVLEFAMESFVEMVDGKPNPQYSIKEIEVKKGDTVRIKVTVTKGSHDFNLDEFNIHEKTPLDEEVTIEFTADKAGEFVYYCSMPGHRANGHWGTLKVVE